MAKKKSKAFVLPKWLPDIGLFALRFCVAFVFIYVGIHKVTQIEVVTEMLQDLKFPIPELLAYVLSYVELIAGVLVLFGVLIRPASALLAFIMFVALLTAHTSLPVNEAFAPIALLGANILLFTTGPGKWSLNPKS